MHITNFRSHVILQITGYDIDKNGLIPDWKIENYKHAFNTITKIDCSYTYLKEIPLLLSNLPNVTEVSCDYSNLTVLPLWPNIQVVRCRYCPIKNLPPWPKIKHVYCRGCSQLELPLWPDVEFHCEDKKKNIMLYKMKMILLSDNLHINPNTRTLISESVGL